MNTQSALLKLPAKPTDHVYQSKCYYYCSYFINKVYYNIINILPSIVDSLRETTRFAGGGGPYYV